MKLIVYLLFVAILLLPGSSIQAQEDTCYASFDINDDGIVLTVADLVHLLRHWAGGYPPVDSLYKADLNGDCIVDGNDVDMLNCFFTYGIAPCFPEWPVPTCCDPLTVIGACCLGDSCSMRTELHCAEIGGEYLGDGTKCLPGEPASTPRSSSRAGRCGFRLGRTFRRRETPARPIRGHAHAPGQ